MDKRTPTDKHYRLEGPDLRLPLVDNFGYNDWHQAGRLTWHFHRGFEIVLILEGSAAYELESGQTIEVSGGEFFFNLPGQKHHGVENRNSPSKMFWIVFDPASPNACQNTTFQPQDLAQIAACCRERAFQALSYTPATRFLLLLLQDAVTREALSSLHAAYLRSLLCQIILETTDTLPPEAKKAPDYVTAAVAQMEKDYAAPLNMDEIAASLGVSRCHFYSVFRAGTGHTPNDYLMRVRIKNAERLLAESGKSITEIAFSTGFNSSQYFCKAFRKYVGQTPTDYRLEHQ